MGDDPLKIGGNSATPWGLLAVGDVSWRRVAIRDMPRGLLAVCADPLELVAISDTP